MARRWCPECEPDADPLTEILNECRCDVHAPDRRGSSDIAVAPGVFLSGSVEVEGEHNRQWCALVHRTAR